MAKKTAPAKKPAAKKPTASKKPAPAKKKPTAPAAFTETFNRLKAILTPYAKNMVVMKDDAEWYYLDTKYTGYNKKPIGFGAVRLGKAYVSFYLMCVYCNPTQMANMSPELKKRMQGKSCFNFKEPSDALFAELAQLTKTSAEWMDTIDWPNYRWTVKK
jgi:hypothetical protein